jgi:hypothetical protein
VTGRYVECVFRAHLNHAAVAHRPAVQIA